MLKWFVWAGGYIPFTRYRKTKWQLPRFKDFAPLSLLGHRMTFYSWGWQLEIPQGYMVHTYNRRDESSSIYISKDATPDNAHAWLLNPPKSIIVKIEERERSWKNKERISQC
jgi:hypothetical protein